MFYPVYVHKDPGSALGMTFPDFPGCFSACDQLIDLQRFAQEAVTLYVDGAKRPLPAPTRFEDWKHDERFVGGEWRLVDLKLP